MADDSSITGLLQSWQQGDESAFDALAPLVYDELHRLAARLFAGERPGHTLQPTALVHELFAGLGGVDVSWQDRAHFFALSARMMRRALVNHARARQAQKRGGDAARVTLHEELVGGDGDTDLLELDEALTLLAEKDERMSRLIELQYFGGLTFDEMAAATGLSTSTIDRELRFARAWLNDRLTRD